MFDLVVGDRSTDTRGERRAAFAVRGCGTGASGTTLGWYSPYPTSDRSRRFFPVAVHPGESLLTERTTDVRACRYELVLMPL